MNHGLSDEQARWADEVYARRQEKELDRRAQDLQCPACGDSATLEWVYYEGRHLCRKCASVWDRGDEVTNESE